MNTEKFESWAIVELFGHTRMAGHVSEQTVGGASFVRVDVPDTDGQPGFTRLLGAGAIYAINPCTEELARAAAGRFRTQPIQAYEIRGLLPATAGCGPSGDPEEWDD